MHWPLALKQCHSIDKDMIRTLVRVTCVRSIGITCCQYRVMRHRSVKGCDGCWIWSIWISRNILCETRDGGTEAYTNSIIWHHSRRHQIELAPRFVNQDNPTLSLARSIVWKTKSKPASRITKYHDDIYIRHRMNFTINQVMLTDVCSDLC